LLDLWPPARLRRAQELPFIASMGIYVVKGAVMKELLMDTFPSANDFGSEIIPGAKDIGKHVQAYLYDGYWEDIGTIEAFYRSNLGLTDSPNPNFRCACSCLHGIGIDAPSRN
jgi:glucose-1-phosphate adenylyltransferase